MTSSIEYEGSAPIRYTNGDLPQVGDIVRLDGFHKGVVVGVPETSNFADESYRHFDALSGGLLIIDDEVGLIVILDDNKEVIFVSRPYQQN